MLHAQSGAIYQLQISHVNVETKYLPIPDVMPVPEQTYEYHITLTVTNTSQTAYYGTIAIASSRFNAENEKRFVGIYPDVYRSDQYMVHIPVGKSIKMKFLRVTAVQLSPHSLKPPDFTLNLRDVQVPKTYQSFFPTQM